ncbi:MAG: cadherin-like beta sandwich domain-containing protein [Kangiellaceae bacterium]|nr:cadherin-like beta sandwich domain-containing protein [Kangiellaceae bacterium]
MSKRFLTQKHLSIWLGLLLVFATGCDWFDGGDGGGEVEPPSENTEFVSLTVSEGSLSPEFTAAGTQYSVDVENSIETLQITATLDASTTSLMINGSAASSGVASSLIPLSVGNNPIDVVVTAESGASRTITITVNRAEPVELSVFLTSLQLSNIAFMPEFDRAGIEYFATVTATTESTIITAVAEDPNATLVYGSQSAVESGQSSEPIQLDIGENFLAVEVHSADDSGIKAYYIQVTREAPSLSDNALLSGLLVSAGDLAPSFVSQTFNYDVAVPNEVDSIVFTPTSADNNAVISISNVSILSGSESESFSLNVGGNGFEIEVDAEDGEGSETYIITVMRGEALSDDASLIGIALSSGNLSPEFNDSTRQYTATVAYLTDSVRLIANLSDLNASVTIDGETAESGIESASIMLLEGDNTIDIIVTAQNGSSSESTTINVIRQSAVEFAQEAYIKASNPGPEDRFGQAVAIDGDTLVVGAYQEDSNGVGINSDPFNDSAVNSGAAFVFVRSFNQDAWTWQQQAYLKPPVALAGKRFGYSVAIEQDTIAIGAYSDNNTGAVYTYTREQTTWTLEKRLVAARADSGDSFGWSVSLNGDLLAVGALGEDSSSTGVNGDTFDNNAPNSGAVYIFSRSTGVWFQQTYIKASNTNTDDNFGWKVALDNGTLVVAAPSEDSAATGINGDQLDNTGTNSGAVYVYILTDNVWSQQAYIKAGNAQGGDEFGRDIGLDGNTLVVGAAYEDSFSADGSTNPENNTVLFSGAAYIFTRNASDWSQHSFLKPSNSEASDFFGESVAIEGNRVVIGATGEDSFATGVSGDESDNNVSNSGAVYLFELIDDVWTQQGYIKASNTGSNDSFGWVALSDSMLVVGAHSEASGSAGVGADQQDNSVSEAGAVYLFFGDTFNH